MKCLRGILILCILTIALWNTKYSDLSTLDKTKAKKDLITPFVKAARKEDLKVGLYYSLLDWSHPDYPNFLRDKKRYTEDAKKWEAFTKFNFGQIEELTKFNPDLYWFDGTGNNPPKNGKLRRYVNYYRVC